MEVDWASLHKILGDTTRRSILELLAEKDILTYTEIMTLLQITNTGRLNYHLKALNSLLVKDESGRYHLTEQGRLAASMLKAFPERAPNEKKPSALKIATAAVLILVGIIIVASFAAGMLYAASPATTTNTSHIALASRPIPENTSVYLTSWAQTGPTLRMTWNAASPVRIFVLNQTQYDSLLLGHAPSSQSPQALQNFTGTPLSWTRDFYMQSGNFSLGLPQGEYRFYVWSPAPSVLDDFSVSQTQSLTEGTSVPLLFYLFGLIVIAVGAFLIVLGVSILTHRVWR